MKFLIASLSAPTAVGNNGGAQVYIFELARSLVKKGHQVDILAGNETKNGIVYPSTEHLSGVNIKRVGNRRFPLFAIIAEIWRTQSGYDIILENMMNYPLYLPLFFNRSKKILGLKHHFLGKTAKEVLPPLKRELNALNEELLIPWLYSGDKLMVPSGKTAGFLQKRSEKFAAVEIIPPGFAYLSVEAAKAPAPTVLYVGALNTSRKKIDHLISAFAEVNRVLTDARLIIAGNGPDKNRLMEMAAGLNVTFKGYVSEAEKHQLYEEAWVFASPSVMEGFGITWIEAQSHGLPVISYQMGLDTLTEDNALLVSPGSIDELTKAMLQLLTDEELRHQMSIAAVDNATRFSWDSSAGKFLDWIGAGREGN